MAINNGVFVPNADNTGSVPAVPAVPPVTPNPSSSGGGGTGLTSAQTTAGATAVVGTNAQNELINATGDKVFKSQIIPRLASLSSLQTLSNNTGEIAVANDKKAIVVLGGNNAVAEGSAYTFYPQEGPYGNEFTYTTLIAPVLPTTTKEEIQNLVGGDGFPTLVSSQAGWQIRGAANTISLTPEVLSYTLGVPTFDSASQGYFAVMDASAGLPLITATAASQDAAQPASFGIFGAASPQITPAITGGSRTAVVGGNAFDDNDTFNGGSGQGYTIGQIVRALKNFGMLAE